MNKSNFHAVLIGFNKFADNARLPDLKFAEKDAHDLYDLLIDPQYGNYPKENITLITGSDLHINLEKDNEYPERVIELAEGKIDAGKLERNDIETILYTQIVNNRTPDDIVLVYYSGHGFIAGKHEQAYLATPEVSILGIQNNPKAGLQMEYLHNDIFLDTKAKFVIFILDCCHSGAFCTRDESKEPVEPDMLENKRLIESKFYSGEGRVAFVSSPREIPSRESNAFKNGVFTYHLLNGLRGAAAEPSGEVTVASLVSYVQRMNPVNQPPIYYGNTTRIVLVNPTR